MRAREFIVENYTTNLPVQDIKHVLSVIKDEAEDVDDASMRYKNQDDPNYKKLENDYHALTAISYILNNNLKAHKLAQENPAVFDTNIFMYDVEPDDVLGGIAAIQVKLDNNVAEIKWLGSYGAPGGKLMKAALDVAKSRGATSVKVDAKWNSEGFYRKMGLDQDINAEPDRGEALRGSKLTAFTGKLAEGGWDTTLTQGTILRPATVKTALQVIDKFVVDFNKWLKSKGVDPISRGKPTGSSSHYQKDIEDNPTKVYGDIDLQMIAPSPGGLSYGQYTTYWNKLADEFINTVRPAYIATAESKPGHPIFQIGADQYVQIDFMWHTPELSGWGAARVTPERGTKGMLHGNMFSVLGELLDMSIQHAGVQLKTVDGVQVPFSKQKGIQVKTISTNPRTFVLDIFKYLFETLAPGKSPRIDPLLKSNPGNNPDDVKIQTLVNAVKGLANSLELNDLYGKGILSKFHDANDFLSAFLERYTQKAMIDIEGKKREKATTPEAIARAQADKDAILFGLNRVKAMFK